MCNIRIGIVLSIIFPNPTNINLLFDAIRKTIILIMCLYGQLNIGGVMSVSEQSGSTGTGVVSFHNFSDYSRYFSD